MNTRAPISGSEVFRDLRKGDSQFRFLGRRKKFAIEATSRQVLISSSVVKSMYRFHAIPIIADDQFRVALTEVR